MSFIRFRKRIIFVSQPPLTDEQLERAFVVEDDLPLFRAMLQLIETNALEATEAAEQSVANPYISASCNGGAEHLKRLRDRMFDLRERGIEQHKKESYGVPTP
jgi:hypothetical protein